MKEEYRAKYLDPRWQKMRLQVLERDEWACQFCFDDKSTLHVHHLWYEQGREPWEYPLDTFLTLCEQCHAEETESLPDAVHKLAHYLKTCGATSGEFDALAECFPPIQIRELQQDTWAIITFGIREVVNSARLNSDEYNALRDRFYALLCEENGESEKH